MNNTDFTIDNKVYETLPNVCIAFVIAHDVDNTLVSAEIDALLDERIKECQESLAGVTVKQIPEVLCFREAFQKLGINPNKFMCSIEALLSRIGKGNSIPHINAAVDLGNAVSLKYKLPIGAHDADTFSNTMMLRFANTEDRFIPFGSQNSEEVDSGELIYVTGHSVRTRRWIWRQSEEGKTTQSSKNIFFPIDGFTDINKEQILKAQQELADLLQKYFNCKVTLGFVSSN